MVVFEIFLLLHITPRVGISDGIYDSDLAKKYDDSEYDELNSYIDHDRDFLFTYAGLRQVADKYLVQDRSSGRIFETPQFAYMLIAMTIFQEYSKETRISYVKRYYDAISKHKINIPTPIMAGVRTPLRQFARLVFLLMLMTPSILSLLLIWQLANTLHKGRESVSTQAESVGSTVRSEAEKWRTQALFLSLKSLNRLSAAVHKMEFEVGQRLSTSQSGTKK